MTKRYGLMGGTFNPVHLGHLMISEYIREEMHLDEIIFIPTGNPPHKETLDAKLRYEMVKLATDENPYFSTSDIETTREYTSYTIDTIEALEKQLDGKLYFIIGSDTLFQLKTWKKKEKLLKKVEFICAIRPDYVSEQILELELKYLQDKYGAVIHIVPTPMYEVSSTDLRGRIAEGKSVKYLIPKEVIAYIEEKGLYR
ncbi:nicotinate-nucleotide adenylyltransferase [Peptoniphilus equinus]|uniref:Probable nicotinate-nucleotide adenylyltransferase n=1 Tax=Peptoniphilus equinus TaxID=3016343 RepID=A0ABY7QR08_9FIRM|nr:nicotinate-nucleotide adenylyltransferase [Peptoniphilus equinus]WBW49212.1 nicotinate-nucleotide adenylyltransferase [Peptoniphilus equinus]